jgi:Tfp pilus assembly protein PilO
MTTLRQNQDGIGHLFAVLAVIVIVGLGFIGYRVSNMNQTTSTDSTSPATINTNNEKYLKNTSDVSAADKQLDSVPVEDDLDPSQLDSDLNAL